MSSSKLFKISENTEILLHQQDCFEGMNALDNESISTIVTSPPYNLGIKYNNYNDGIPREKYLNWIDHWTIHISQILSPDGSLFLNLGSSPKNPWISMEVAKVVGKHLKLQNVFHWIKAISIDQEYLSRHFPGSATLSVGHYKPVCSKRFVNDCHEYIFHFTHQGDVNLDRKAIGVPFQDKSNIKRWKSVGEDRRCRGNNWYIPYDTINYKERDRPHPASFPKKLVENCLRIHGIGNNTRVLDPFMGIGTTALVCADLNLSCLGFEIDNLYYNESIRRLKSRFNQPELSFNS
ncbi:site-specific DNA-methyltransferase [bacterium]|nr:site-specific DNA-methyltransferase [bacterium]